MYEDAINGIDDGSLLNQSRPPLLDLFDMDQLDTLVEGQLDYLDANETTSGEIIKRLSELAANLDLGQVEKLREAIE